jgi:CMP-N,N'-diacetyllegionaminic acid synthase
MVRNPIEILAIIPARGGSKGIPRKNIKSLAGKPLLAYTAVAAKNSRLLTRVVLSTDDQEIALIGTQLGLEVPFIRPSELAEDDTPSLLVFDHVLCELYRKEGYKPDVIVILQPTSPLRTTRHIDEALNKFLSQNYDSLVSVIELPHNMNPYSVMKLNSNGELEPFMDYDESKNTRQFKPKFYARNGAAIYIVTYDCLMNKKSIYGKSTLPYFMKKEESLDIDDSFDWLIAEFLLAGLAHSI